MTDKITYSDNNKLMDEALKSDPGYFLSAGFAEKVALKAEKISAINQYLSEFIIYFVTILGIITVAGGIYFWLSPDWKPAIQFITSNIPIFARDSDLLIFMLFANKILLRYFLNHTSPKVF